VDIAGIDAALGRKGSADGGIYKFTVTRKQTIAAGDHVLPAGLGLTTSISFQPVGAGKAAINGDFALTGEEINPVIAALRKGGIAIVEVHNHSLDEQPRLFYLHFWAVDDAVTLVKALRLALDATNVKPPADISAHHRTAASPTSAPTPAVELLAWWILGSTETTR